MTPVRMEPAAPRSQIKDLNTEQLHFLYKLSSVSMCSIVSVGPKAMQLFFMLNSVVGILTFISRINATSKSIKQKKCYFSVFYFL